MSASVAASRLVSIGHYQPARVLDNDELAATVDTSDEWIRTRVGIVTRRMAAPNESVTDMAVAAAAKTLARSGIDAKEIDLVIVATCTATERMPNIASRVARQLGVPHAAGFDVNVACSGFSYALALADQAIRTGTSHRAIIVGVDKMSDFLDWTDRSTCILFGDGAGAAILAATDRPGRDGVGPVLWGSQPEKGAAITLESSDPGGPAPLFRQDGQAVYRWATTTLAPIAREACRRAGIEPEELAAVVTHQANLRIIDTIVDKIGAHHAIVARDVTESGNTSAASIPLALSKLVEKGELADDAPVLLLGFGAGLSYAAQVVRSPSS